MLLQGCSMKPRLRYKRGWSFLTVQEGLGFRMNLECEYRTCNWKLERSFPSAEKYAPKGWSPYTHVSEEDPSPKPQTQRTLKLNKNHL